MWHKMKVVADLVGASIGFYCIFWIAREWGRQEAMDALEDDSTTTEIKSDIGDITLDDIASGRVYIKQIGKNVYKISKIKNA